MSPGGPQHRDSSGDFYLDNFGSFERFCDPKFVRYSVVSLSSLSVETRGESADWTGHPVGVTCRKGANDSSAHVTDDAQLIG
jgi:hypothetical protein